MSSHRASRKNERCREGKVLLLILSGDVDCVRRPLLVHEPVLMLRLPT